MRTDLPVQRPQGLQQVCLLGDRASASLAQPGDHGANQFGPKASPSHVIGVWISLFDIQRSHSCEKIT